jgi:hypothetical protein
MSRTKKPVEELLETAKDFRKATVVELREKLLREVDPEVDRYLLNALEKEASKRRNISELRSDIDDDLENPIPEEDNYDEGDGLGMEDDPLASEISAGKEDIDLSTDSEIGDPPPTSDELDSGDVEILQIKVNGREYEAEVGSDDNTIIFKAVDAPEEGIEGEFGEEDEFELPEEDGDFGEEEKFDIGGEGDDNIDVNLEDEDEDEEERMLRREVLNRIAKKRKSGLSEQEILDDYRGKIREKLTEKLSTNIHEKVEKPKRKVTIEEHLKNRQLTPDKYKKDMLTEVEERQIYNRFSDLCNLG